MTNRRMKENMVKGILIAFLFMVLSLSSLFAPRQERKIKSGEVAVENRLERNTIAGQQSLNTILMEAGASVTSNELALPGSKPFNQTLLIAVAVAFTLGFVILRRMIQRFVKKIIRGSE